MKKQSIVIDIPYNKFEERIQLRVIKTSELIKKTVFDNVTKFNKERIFIGKIKNNYFRIYSKPYYPGPDFLNTSFLKLWFIWTAPVFCMEE